MLVFVQWMWTNDDFNDLKQFFFLRDKIKRNSRIIEWANIYNEKQKETYTCLLNINFSQFHLWRFIKFHSSNNLKKNSNLIFTNIVIFSALTWTTHLNYSLKCLASKHLPSKIFNSKAIVNFHRSDHGRINFLNN